MADFELDDAQEGQESKPKAKPKPKPKKSGGGGGGGSPVTIIAFAVALASLGLAVFMFMQFQSMKSKLLADTGDNPPGTPAEAATAEGGEEGGESTAVQAVREEPENIVYHLGEFTGNTSDGRFAKMDISLQIQSYYNAEDWAVYESQMEVYREKLKFYQEYEMGKIDAEGKPIGDHAYLPTGMVHASYRPTGPVPAQHGGAPAAEPPTMPEEPARPMSRMERELQRQDAMIRTVVIEQINTHTAAQIISPSGKEEFKQALINAINKTVEAHIGVVKDVYFSQLVTT